MSFIYINNCGRIFLNQKDVCGFDTHLCDFFIFSLSNIDTDILQDEKAGDTCICCIGWKFLFYQLYDIRFGELLIVFLGGTVFEILLRDKDL